MIVLGRRHQGSGGGTVSFGAFLPAWDMAATMGAKLFAGLRPFVKWIRVSFESDHSVARRFTRGVLDRPFRPENRIRWQLLVGMKPDDFLAAYVPSVSNECSLRTFVKQRRRLVVYMIHVIGTGGSYVARRIINFPRKQAYHDILISHEIPPIARRKLAYTANMLRSAVSFYDRFDISLIYLTAGLSAGGRLWPKYGFQPVNSREWMRCRKRILSNLAQMPQNIQARWRAQIQGLVDDPNPKNLRIIYRITEWVPDLKNANEFRRLGPVLLTGTRWNGVLDLADVDSRGMLAEAIQADFRASLA